MRLSAGDRARERQQSRGLAPLTRSVKKLGARECCVLAHVVVAGLDPDRVVDDRIRVDAGAEALVDSLSDRLVVDSQAS